MWRSSAFLQSLTVLRDIWSDTGRGLSRFPLHGYAGTSGVENRCAAQCLQNRWLMAADPTADPISSVLWSWQVNGLYNEICG